VTFQEEPYITTFVRENADRIRRILADSSLDIVEKATMLRSIARRRAAEDIESMSYGSLDEFEEHYDRGETPLTRLEGPGFRKGDLFILKSCPMVPVFGEFRENGGFPDFWTETTQSYMARFGNSAILHPLCIFHQTFRDQLTARIPKGDHYVHSITVACRSGANGKIVYCPHGLEVSGLDVPTVEDLIRGWACAFYAT